MIGPGPQFVFASPSGIPALRRPSYVRSLDLSVEAALLGLEVRLACRDRLERPGGGQREVALQRLARFRIMIGQGERRHKDRMNILAIFGLIAIARRAHSIAWS